MTTATAPYPASFESYTPKRDQLLRWAQINYVDEFKLKPGKFLDAGCAEGFWADVFCDLGFESYGFDYLPIYIENGRKRYPRVNLQVADIDNLPYEPNEFDVVLARGLPHFSRYRLADMKSALSNLLPLGSTLLLSIYSDDSGEKRPGVYKGSHWHHTHERLLAACAEVSKIKHYAKVGNYLQVAL